MAKPVDARDLKSLGREAVRVRPPPSAPAMDLSNSAGSAQSGKALEQKRDSPSDEIMHVAPPPKVPGIPASAASPRALCATRSVAAIVV